jgi:hypothetical protein
MSGLISTAGYGFAEKVYATIQSHCFWSLSYHLDWHINHVLGLIMWPFAAACGLGFEAKKALEGYRLWPIYGRSWVGVVISTALGLTDNSGWRHQRLRPSLVVNLERLRGPMRFGG